MKMFRNRMLGRIFGPNMEEVIQGYRNMHNEKLPGSLSCDTM